MRELRGGDHDVLWLASVGPKTETEELNGSEPDEIRAFIRADETPARGLILSGRSLQFAKELGDVLGVRFRGFLPSGRPFEVHREVEGLPSPFHVKRKGKYPGRKRGRKPADPVSVVMALALKVMLVKSYRSTYALLASDWSLRRLAGIRELPHCNTMQAHMDRLPTGYPDELIRRTCLRFVEFKKSPAGHAGGGPSTPPASAPTGGPPGSTSACASASPAGSS
ncbi:MAG: hypothetical protein QXO51_06975 [Halobacteria archaeon]